MSVQMRVTDQFQVELISHIGGDELICKTVRGVNDQAAALDTEGMADFINFLMDNREGSPFETSQMTFRIHAPIFVWREFMRHNAGISYSEESALYKELEPVFYMPPMSRNIVQLGDLREHNFLAGDQRSYSDMFNALSGAYEVAWKAYLLMREDNIAREVAGMCLPTSIYSTAYVTMNPRSIMNFLSFSTKSNIAFFRSFPMQELNQVADKIETYFKQHFPLTKAAFDTHGRVSP